MRVANTSLVAVVMYCLCGVAHAAPDAPRISLRPEVQANLVETSLSAYRHYAMEQAGLLVGMTRALSNELKDGNAESAQTLYAPAHRYLVRLEPLLRTMDDLRTRLDARVEGLDASASGFHRLEAGLFANGQKGKLSDVADKLDKDSRQLRARIVLAAMTPDALVLGAAETLKDAAARKLDGTEERYAKTDLWDIEADVEGVREMTTHLAPVLRAHDPAAFDRAAAAYGEIDAVLAKYKEGCGFKPFDTVAQADRTTLKRRIAALAGDVAALRPAID